MTAKSESYPDSEYPNRPLVEVILEVSWYWPESTDKTKERVISDKEWKPFAFNFAGKVSSSYPHVEPMPVSNVPAELSNRQLHYRFWAAKGKWPLCQVGPSIVAYNETSSYRRWVDFYEKASKVVDHAIECLGKTTETNQPPQLNSLVLRYINAIEFDHSQEDASSYIEKHMKFKRSFPSEDFLKKCDVSYPREFVSKAVYDMPDFDGKGIVQVSTGITKGPNPTETSVERNAIIVEFSAVALRHDLREHPLEMAYIKEWADGAHQSLHHWFESLFSDEMMTYFKTAGATWPEAVELEE